MWVISPRRRHADKCNWKHAKVVMQLKTMYRFDDKYELCCKKCLAKKSHQWLIAYNVEMTECKSYSCMNTHNHSEKLMVAWNYNNLTNVSSVDEMIRFSLKCTTQTKQPLHISPSSDILMRPRLVTRIPENVQVKLLSLPLTFKSVIYIVMYSSTVR